MFLVYKYKNEILEMENCFICNIKSLSRRIYRIGIAICCNKFQNVVFFVPFLLQFFSTADTLAAYFQ